MDATLITDVWKFATESGSVAFQVIIGVLIIVSGAINTYSTNSSKTKLTKNSDEFKTQFNEFKTQFDDIKMRLLEISNVMEVRSQRLDVLEGTNKVIRNSLIYSNNFQLSTFLVYVSDMYFYFTDALMLDALNDRKYLIHKLAAFRLSITGKDGKHKMPDDYVDRFEENTKAIFNRFETDLIRLSEDTVNNKISRFNSLSFLFIQDLLSTAISSHL